jgi:BAG domain
LESNKHGDKRIPEKEITELTELLMVQLLKLDSIEADGEAKAQRRIEVSTALPSWSLCILIPEFVCSQKYQYVPIGGVLKPSTMEQNYTKNSLFYD